jgi:tetratricopeptide (TPR) repeat protein
MRQTSSRRWLIRSIGYTVLVGFAVPGCLGILRSLPPLRVFRAEPSAAPPHDRLVAYADRRVAQLARRVRSAPADPDLRLALAQAYASRATARAQQEYSAAFPDDFDRNGLGADQYEQWRRGWYRRDPDGDLRRATAQARHALALHPSPQRRLAALRLIAQILREQCRHAAAAAALREIVALEPNNRTAWLQLYWLYTALGDRRRCHEVRRRLKALEAAGAALVPEHETSAGTRGYGLPGREARAALSRRLVANGCLLV